MADTAGIGIPALSLACTGNDRAGCAGVREPLAGLTLPVHLIRGRLSELVTRQAAEDFVASCPTPSSPTSPAHRTWSRAIATTPFLDAVVGFLERMDLEAQADDR
jgi:hypothetical protein